MNPIYSQLCADHYNLLRLLRTLEAEIACYEAGNQGDGRLPVMLDIFDYVQVYPEKWHHPIEEALFELLLVKQVESSEMVWGARAEHNALEELTHKTHELFLSVANDTVVPIDTLAGAARDFINRQMDHVNKENRFVYPLLEKFVSEQEWRDIAAKVSEHQDPVFSDELKKEYSHLHKSILRSERGVAMGAVARAYVVAG